MRRGGAQAPPATTTTIGHIAFASDDKGEKNADCERNSLTAQDNRAGPRLSCKGARSTAPECCVASETHIALERAADKTLHADLFT